MFTLMNQGSSLDMCVLQILSQTVPMFYSPLSMSYSCNPRLSAIRNSVRVLFVPEGHVANMEHCPLSKSLWEMPCSFSPTSGLFFLGGGEWSGK